MVVYWTLNIPQGNWRSLIINWSIEQVDSKKKRKNFAISSFCRRVFEGLSWKVTHQMCSYWNFLYARQYITYWSFLNLKKKSESVTIVFFRHCGFGSPIYREAGACGKVLITFDLAAILPVALSSIVHSSTPNSIYYIITTMPRVYYDRSV